MKRSFQWWWVAILVLPIGFGLLRLRMDVEVLNLLPADVPAVHGLKLQQRYFANMRELVITVSGDQAEATEATAQSLAVSLRRETNLISYVVWQPPWLEHPEQTAELIAYLWMNQPPEALKQFARTLQETNLPGVLNAAREQLSTSLSPLDIGRLSYDPYGFTRLPEEGTAAPAALTMGQEWFASKDGTFRVMFIGPGKDLGNYRDSAAWFEQIKQIVQDCERTGKWGSGIKIGFTGTPAFMADIAVGMERDIKSSVLGTLVVIGLLFWIAHRRWIPLLWLITLLSLILACTMAAGGILFGTLNVVSLGFTAILLGLAVDYALILYQEAVSSRELPIAEVRRSVAPAIWWSALTTAGAFFLLNFGGMPGLSQLGSLVAVGILIAATVMIYAYLPVALRRRPAAANVASGNHGTNPSSPSYLPWALTVVVICGVALILWWQFPGVDHSTKPLQPSHSAAESALQEMKTKLDQPGEPVLMLVSGTNETVIATKLERMQEVLSASVSNKEIRSFTLPHQLWPRPEHQRENRVTALQLARQEESLRAAAVSAGFTTNAVDMAQSILSSWRVMAANPATIWPSNAANRWIIEKVVGRTETGLLALGVAYGEPDSGIYSWAARLTKMVPGISVTGWHLLGESLLERVEKRTWSLSGAMLVFVALCLWLAFRTIREVLLSFAALASELAHVARRDVACGVVMEPLEPNGPAVAVGSRGGLYDSHATGFAAPSRRLQGCAAGDRSCGFSLRRNHHRRFWFTGVVQQLRLGQPGSRLRDWCWLRACDQPVPAAGLVVCIERRDRSGGSELGSLQKAVLLLPPGTVGIRDVGCTHGPKAGCEAILPSVRHTLFGVPKAAAGSGRAKPAPGAWR